VPKPILKIATTISLGHRNISCGGDMTRAKARVREVNYLNGYDKRQTNCSHSTPQNQTTRHG